MSTNSTSNFFNNPHLPALKNTYEKTTFSYLSSIITLPPWYNVTLVSLKSELKTQDIRHSLTFESAESNQTETCPINDDGIILSSASVFTHKRALHHSQSLGTQ